MITEWNDKELIARVKEIAEDVAKQGAEWVKKDAKKILMSKAKHPTGELASQIDIKASKFESGGYIVQAQGPGNWRPPYRASFVELGTHKMQAIPFLRPALKKNESKIHRKYQEQLS